MSSPSHCVSDTCVPPTPATSHTSTSLGKPQLPIYTGTCHLYPHATQKAPLERYTGVSKLENYIENTKQTVANNLPTICDNRTSNLSPIQRTSLNKLKHSRQSLTIKPADKNLGIVLMDTEDYITQCMAHLSDSTTYRLTTAYPKDIIQRQLQNTVTSFKEQLEPYNKQLYTLLREGPRHPRIPQFYGIPKIHKKFTKLPPMRPIVSQSSSILSPRSRPSTPCTLISRLCRQFHRTFPHLTRP